MNLDQLNKDLTKAKNQLAAAGSDDEKAFAQKKIDKLTDQIAAAEKEGSSELKPKPAKKKSVKKTSKKASPKPAVKSTGKVKMIDYKGKTYREDDPEYCEMLKKDITERRKKRKETQGKVKTKSISFKVGDDIADGVLKAIKNVDDKQLSANPTKYIAKFTHVSKVTEKYLSQLKDILGPDYNATELKRPLSAIKTAIDRIKAKYKRKK